MAGRRLAIDVTAPTSSVVVCCFVEICPCLQQNLDTLVWVPGETCGRCHECLCPVDTRRLPAAHRVAYLVLRSLWGLQHYRPAGAQVAVRRLGHNQRPESLAAQAVEPMAEAQEEHEEAQEPL